MNHEPCYSETYSNSGTKTAIPCAIPFKRILRDSEFLILSNHSFLWWKIESVCFQCDTNKIDGTIILFSMEKLTRACTDSILGIIPLSAVSWKTLVFWSLMCANELPSFAYIFSAYGEQMKIFVFLQWWFVKE